MNLSELLKHLEGVKKSGNGWVALCPAHEDRRQSLSISRGAAGRILIKCFAGCDVEDILKALGLEKKDLFDNVGVSYPSIQGVPVSHLAQHTENKAKLQKKTGTTSKNQFVPVTQLQCSLQDYTDAKKLPKSFLEALGITESTYRDKTKLVVPYFDTGGELICNRFRLSISGGQKFAWEKGAHPCLYGLWLLKNHNDDFVVLVEGESCCQTLWFNEIPAVGLPGSSTFKNERDAPHLKKFKTIYVVIEPDNGGNAVLKSIRNSSIKEHVKLVTLPCKDASDLYLDSPERFKTRFHEALSQAMPFFEYERVQIQKQESEAWLKCKDLVQSKNILDSVYHEVQNMGITGEAQMVKLLFLAMVSRLLDRPVSMAIKGPSSAGKSFVLDAVVKFFPKDAYYSFTAMSDRTLAFTEADLRHRVILLAEASGLSSDFQSYLIRTLLSEGRIIYETVEKTSDGFKPRRIEKEGPTGFICTTTAVNLHPENETRMLSLTVNDTQGQTKAILLSLAGNQNRKCDDVGEWHALQVWLETQPKGVEIPYAMELAERIPPVAVRLRRDFTTVLNLIKANAILHQANRGRNNKGAIMASLEDYKVVYSLLGNLMAEGVEATVPVVVREVVGAVAEITSEKENATAREVTTLLKIDRAAVKRRIRRATNLNYLRNENPGRGKRAKYVIGDPLPEDIQILPEPASLTGTLGQTGKMGVVPLEQAEDIIKTTTFANWDSGTPEIEGINKHKHVTEKVVPEYADF